MSEQEFELYLKLLARCLNLTAGQREQIADELRDHLEQRLEELARTGVPRDQAIVQALDEFGDAAVLAAHFTTIARLRRRRLIMRFSLSSVAAVTVAVLAAFALWPDNQAGQGPPRVIGKTEVAAEPEGPIKVDVALPISREVTDHEDFAGVLAPSRTVTITAEVTGRLQEAAFPAGGMVKSGDVLFRIDPGIYPAELTKAEAESMRAAAHLKRAQADLNVATAANKAAQITAPEMGRFKGAVQDAEADIRSAQASVQIANLNLARTTLTAPISGYLSRPTIDPGNLITANVTSLATLVSLDPMSVAFNVDEATFLRLRKAVRDGQLKESDIPVTMSLPKESDYHRRGKLESLEGTIQRMGNVPMRAVFDNADSALIPGLKIYIRVVTSQPYNALLVPQGAVTAEKASEQAMQRYILVVNDQRMIERREVTLGPREGELWAVKEGLKPQDRVVISDRKNLRPGMTVEAEVK